MKDFYLKYKSQIYKFLFIICFFGSIYIFLNYIFSYVAPFAIAFVISLLINPLVDKINTKFKIPRWILSLSSILLVLFGIYILGNSIVSRIIKEAQGLIKEFPETLESLKTLLSSVSDWTLNIFDKTPEGLHDTIMQIINNLSSTLTNSIGKVFKDNSWNIVSKIPNLFMSILLILISLFFFLKDKEIIRKGISSVTPYWLKKNLVVIKKGVIEAIGGYIKAQAIIMSIIFLICAVSLSILNYKYALIVAIGIGFLDALPIFGSGFILWPWAAMSLFYKDYKMAVGLLITYLIILVTRQVLEPKVLGKQIGIYPLITLISIYAGLKFFGPLGFILGPFTVITIKTIANSDIYDGDKKKEVIVESSEISNS